MITRLTAMDVANASVYDGASALAEAILMSVRANRGSKSRRVLIAGNVDPRYRRVCENIIRNQKIEIDVVAWAADTGLTDQEQLANFVGQDYAAMIIAYPSFFGGLQQNFQQLLSCR